MRQQSIDRSTTPTPPTPRYQRVQQPFWVRSGRGGLFLLCTSIMIVLIPFFSSLLAQRPRLAIVPFALIGLLFVGGCWALSAQLNAQKRGCTIRHTLSGHTDSVTIVAWSPDGRSLASGYGGWRDDNTVRLWDASTGALRHTLSDHSSPVTTVVWSPDGRSLASGHGGWRDDNTVRLWDASTGALRHTLSGHTDSVTIVAWSPDGRFLASSSLDCTVRLWDASTGALRHILSGHTSPVSTVAWSPDGHILASCSSDNAMRLWDASTGALRHILSGHTSPVSTVAWSPDGRTLASCSYDRTVRLWDASTGTLMTICEGHTDPVRQLAFSPDGRLLASLSVPYFEGGFLNSTVRLWRTDTWESVALLSNLGQGIHSSTILAFHPQQPVLATLGTTNNTICIWDLDLPLLMRASACSDSLRYTNAKVVLVGDSGVGKSGLGLVLAGEPFVPTESTHGRRIWTFVPREGKAAPGKKQREILLWDLAGQPGYRLIHQLHLGEVTVALVVFDARSETDPFAGVQYWERALRQAQLLQGSAALPLTKFLVAARSDRGGIGVSPERIQRVAREAGFAGCFQTSAKTGQQVAELRTAIEAAIAWDHLPTVSSTRLFQQIKDFLKAEKKAGRLLPTSDALYRQFLSTKRAPAETRELPAQFETCIGRLQAAGLMQRLSFGNLLLLQPELLDAYASALVNAVRDEPDGLGSISEARARSGDFSIPPDERLHDPQQEKLLLIAMIEDLLQHDLVLREGDLLVFPSQSTRERGDLPDPRGKSVVWCFEGAVYNIYATLAVRLANSGGFKKLQLWKNAVTYTATAGGTCGMFLRVVEEGRAELTLFYDQATGEDTRLYFEGYVQAHLERRAVRESCTRRRLFRCDNCGHDIPESTVLARRERGHDWITCPVCEKQRIVLRDREESPATTARTAEMDRVADEQRGKEVAISTLQGKEATQDFDVFLCYHPDDRPAVKWIGEQLKAYGMLPWLDEWALQPGLPWQRVLEEQIGHIKSAAVFVGRQGIGPWQQLELDTFLREFVRRKCPVIPVLLENAPLEPQLPIFLQGMTWVDFRRRDVNAMERLLWGITGKRV